MIRLYYRERLGNYFSQYCFGRLLAHRFKYALAACPIAGFHTSFSQIEGEELLGPEVMWAGHWPREVYSGRGLERAELWKPPGAKLILSGYFQRFEYISDIRDEVRGDWLRVNDPLPVRPSGDFVICLRLGDGKVVRMADGKEEGTKGDSALNEAEIRRLVRTVRHERLYLLTDAPGHPLVAAVRDLGAEVVSLGGMADFRFIHSFQKVAICQSTFHWWAAFLGAAREIYFPKIDRGPWSHPEPAVLAHDPAHWGIDLRVTDDERYIYDW